MNLQTWWIIMMGEEYFLWLHDFKAHSYFFFLTPYKTGNFAFVTNSDEGKLKGVFPPSERDSKAIVVRV